MSFTCDDDTSENEEVSSEYQRYRPSDLGEVEEPYPMMENERQEVDISVATGAVLEALYISED